jgi:hypothetical protein
VPYASLVVNIVNLNDWFYATTIQDATSVFQSKIDRYIDYTLPYMTNTTPPLEETFTYREYIGTLYYKPNSSEVSVVVANKRYKEVIDLHFTSSSVSEAWPTFQQVVDDYLFNKGNNEDYDEPSLFYRGYMAMVYRIAKSTDLHIDIPGLGVQYRADSKTSAMRIFQEKVDALLLNTVISPYLTNQKVTV